MRTRINFNHLECFLTLAKSLSFSKTALILNIAQPAVSKQIQSLEELLKANLFIRTKKSVVLSQEGEKLYQLCSKPFHEICEQIESHFFTQKEPQGLIRFATIREVGEKTFIPLLSEFKRKFDKIRIEVEFLKTFQIVDKIKNGQLDMAVIPEKMELESFRSYPVFKEEIILVGNKELKKKSTGPLHLLPYVAYRDNDPLIPFFIRSLSPKTKLTRLNLEFCVNSHKSMVQILLHHPYYAVLPKLSIEQELKDKKLFQIREESLDSSLYLIMPETNFKNDRRELLANFLRSKLIRNSHR